MITAQQANEITEKNRVGILKPIENAIVRAAEKGHNFIQLEVDSFDDVLKVALDSLTHCGYGVEVAENPQSLVYTYKISW